jgi:predicted nucleic acid-binding protein
MKLLLDACVLYPATLRRILLGVAGERLIAPLWSDRILGEWVHAAARRGPAAAAEAAEDARSAAAAFPRARVADAPAIAARLVLPDPDDRHVLASAIAGGAEAIVTFNAADFPRHVLAAEGIARRDPDGLLWELWSHHPAAVAAAVGQARAVAERIAGQPLSQQALLRRAKLPRLARALQDG